MSIQDLAQRVGQEYLLDIGEFTIVVMVEDMKISYGNVRAYVCPVGGLGHAWINACRLKKMEG
jgi:hypothetical protein